MIGVVIAVASSADVRGVLGGLGYWHKTRRNWIRAPMHHPQGNRIVAPILGNVRGGRRPERFTADTFKDDAPARLFIQASDAVARLRRYAKSSRNRGAVMMATPDPSPATLIVLDEKPDWPNPVAALASALFLLALATYAIGLCLFPLPNSGGVFTNLPLLWLLLAAMTAFINLPRQAVSMGGLGFFFLLIQGVGYLLIVPPALYGRMVLEPYLFAVVGLKLAGLVSGAGAMALLYKLSPGDFALKFTPKGGRTEAIAVSSLILALLAGSVWMQVHYMNYRLSPVELAGIKGRVDTHPEYRLFVQTWERDWIDSCRYYYRARGWAYHPKGYGAHPFDVTWTGNYLETLKEK